MQTSGQFRKFNPVQTMNIFTILVPFHREKKIKAHNMQSHFQPYHQSYPLQYPYTLSQTKQHTHQTHSIPQNPTKASSCLPPLLQYKKTRFFFKTFHPTLVIVDDDMKTSFHFVHNYIIDKIIQYITKILFLIVHVNI